MFCNIPDLKNESDVEQKFIYPMLSTISPSGFGYLNSEIQTKPNIKEVAIGKGASKKNYRPDYVITTNGIPLLVIEAKSPLAEDDLNEAFREARLYCHEINSNLSSGINPCKFIIVSNGLTTKFGYWDSEEPKITLQHEHINIANDSYSNLVNTVSKKALQNEAEKILSEIRKNSYYYKPLDMLGGKTVRDEELPPNSFGTNLTFALKNIFNPETLEERANIAKFAYVSSRKRTKQFESVVRAAFTPSETNSTLIKDTTDPSELVSILKDTKLLRNSLILLIGNVGAGKSTFVDYLRVVVLDKSIQEHTSWVLLDLNNAPLNKAEIYNWVMEKIIEELQSMNKEVDFNKAENIEKIYSKELSAIEGILSILDKNSSEYKTRKVDELLRLKSDKKITAKGMVHYLCKSRAKTLIVVLDNCDKRTKDDQLLMFEVAKWVKEEFDCLVFLPIRNTTYDSNRSQPPLDTTIKDLLFKIEAPLLTQVILKRIQYALKTFKEHYEYSLQNGMRVSHKKEEIETYFRCMAFSLFENDTFFRRLVLGIAGRDTRKGIEIFVNFCRSGHIKESEIFKSRVSDGEYKLPHHIITRVLIRGNRKYYSDASSFILNLFKSHHEDKIPDPFVRISILQWLKSKSQTKGPNNIKGFHKISSLIEELKIYGHSENRIREEIKQFINHGCITTESQKPSAEIVDEELINISETGHIHLSLLHNLDYLSSCAEDVFYQDSSFAEKIKNRLSGSSVGGHLSLQSNIENAEDLLTYLQKYREKFFLAKPQVFLNEDRFEKLTDLESSLKTVEEAKVKKGKWAKGHRSEEYKIGSIHEAQVVSIQDYGIFVDLDLETSGLVHKTKLKDDIHEIDLGDYINVKILDFNEDHHRYQLEQELKL